MIRKGFSVIHSPAKTYASIEVSAASQPVQEFDAVTGQHYPDRSLVPLVLTPIFGYIDTDTGAQVANAAALLTDGHWFRLDNTSSGALDSTTEITSGSSYSIDTTAGSATFGRITISENVSPGNNVTYIFRATLSLPSGEKVRMEASWQARAIATATAPVLSVDNATEHYFNPWGDNSVFPVNPVLRPAVAGTVYSWESLHDNTWGPLGDTHLDWAVEQVGDGIKVNRAIMQDRLDLRLTAQIPVSGDGSISQSVTVAIVRRLPDFEYDIHHLADIMPDNKSISPAAYITTGNQPVTDTKGEVSVKWYNAAGTQIAEGVNPVIQISQLGTSLDVGLDIQDKGGWKALMSGNAFVTDSSGALIICK